MKRINIILYISIAVFIVSGLLFIKSKRHEGVISIIENIRGKDIVFYSSNFKREYMNTKKSQETDMNKLCAEGASILKGYGFNSNVLRIQDGSLNPFTSSGLYLDKNLQKSGDYILIDITRNQSVSGKKYKAGDVFCCPLKIIISKKSKSYNNSLLFAGRLKSLVDIKYSALPFQIATTDTEEYNQSKGYIGLLVELGDAANTYEEARESLRIFCEAIREVSGPQ